MNPLDLIAKAKASPATHAVVTRYVDGREERHETRNAKAAEMWAIGERRKIGRDLVSRATGATVQSRRLDPRDSLDRDMLAIRMDHPQVKRLARIPAYDARVTN